MAFGKSSLELALIVDRLRMIMMRSAVYDRSSGCRIRTVHFPSSPSNGEIRVHIHAAGMNPVDAKFVIGDKIPFDIKWLQNGKPIGFDFCGDIESVGDGSKYKKGDKVFGLTRGPYQGAFADFLVTADTQVALVPSTLTYFQGACLGIAGVTASQILRSYKLADTKNKRRILVVGASGGVGHIFVQLAQHYGHNVSAIASLKNKPFVERLCSASTSFYAYDAARKNEDFLVAIPNEPPFDFVLDTVSSIDEQDSHNYHNRIVRANLVGPASHYITIGGSMWGWIRAGLKKFGWDLFPKNQELFWIDPYNCNEDLSLLADVASQGGLQPHCEIMSFSEKNLQLGFQAMHSRRQQGKLVYDLSVNYSD